MGLFQTMANNGNELLLLTLSRTNKEIVDLKLEIRELEIRIGEASARIELAKQTIRKITGQPLPGDKATTTDSSSSSSSSSLLVGLAVIVVIVVLIVRVLKKK